MVFASVPKRASKHGYWGPGYGTPIPHIQLPFNCNKPNRKGGWPATMEGNRLTAEGEAIWLETCRQFKEHFDSNPTWSKVRRVVSLGGLDETYRQWAYEKMIYFCRLLRRGLGKDWADLGLPVRPCSGTTTPQRTSSRR
jgi:hypothetical protein